MKTKLLSLFAVTAVVLLAGCSTAPAKYTYVVDPGLTDQADNLTRTNTHTSNVVWLNPPMKRVPLQQNK